MKCVMVSVRRSVIDYIAEMRSCSRKYDRNCHRQHRFDCPVYVLFGLSGIGAVFSEGRLVDLTSSILDILYVSMRRPLAVHPRI